MRSMILFFCLALSLVMPPMRGEVIEDFSEEEVPIRLECSSADYKNCMVVKSMDNSDAQVNLSSYKK